MAFAGAASASVQRLLSAISVESGRRKSSAIANLGDNPAQGANLDEPSRHRSLRQNPIRTANITDKIASLWPLQLAHRHLFCERRHGIHRLNKQNRHFSSKHGHVFRGGVGPSFVSSGDPWRNTFVIRCAKWPVLAP
jgi:hypothetical protein